MKVFWISCLLLGSLATLGLKCNDKASSSLETSEVSEEQDEQNPVSEAEQEPKQGAEEEEDLSEL